MLPAGCPWDGCWKGASGSLAAFLSEWPPALKTCPLHLWQVTRSPCQISDRKFKPKVCPKSRDSWGNIPRHVCLLRLGEPGFGAHLHCLSEKCKACSWQCWSPTAALGGTLIHLRNVKLNSWLLVKLRHGKDEASPGQRCNMREGK